MPTIKELYDQGQRQFPMRGGGISPKIQIYRQSWQCYDGSFEWSFRAEGFPFWDINGVSRNNEGLRLLPEPLPNQSDKDQRVAELEVQLKQVEKYLIEFEKFIIGRTIKLSFGDKQLTDLLAYRALKRAIAGEAE